MTNKLFILNFESGLWIHAATEAKIAQQAAKDGWEVATINCDGFLKGFCSVRASRNRTVAQVTKGIDCKDCLYTNKSTSRINQARGVANIQLGKLLSAEHLHAIKLLLSEAKELDDPLDFEYSGMKLGRIASHETMLRYKQTEASIPLDGLDDYFLQLEDCLRVFFSFSILLADVSKGSKFLIRNTDYSTHRVVAMMAEKAGHIVVNMSEPMSFNRVYSYAKFDRFISGVPSRYSYRNSFDSVPMRFDPTPYELKSMDQYIDFLAKAKGYQVYSRKKTSRSASSLRQSLQIPQGNKVFLIALSSTDEVLALKTAHGEFPYPGDVFRDQFEMLEAVQEWASGQENISLIIRPHPREASGTRNLIQSKSLAIWGSKVDDQTLNVVLDSPEEARSLYDILSISDVVVTGWSSVGLEATILGKTAITYDASLPTYSCKFMLSGKSKMDFVHNLEASSEISAKQLDHLRNLAFSWMLFDIRCSISVPGRFLTESYNKFGRSFQKIINFADLSLPLLRVLDLITFKPNFDLQRMYQVFLGARNTSYMATDHKGGTGSNK